MATDTTSFEFAAGRGSFIGDIASGSWAETIPYDLRVSSSNTDHFLVQYAGPISRDWRASLADLADGRLEYLPHFTFLVRLSSDAREELDGHPEVRAIEPYHPGLKLSPALKDHGTVEAVALVYRDADPSMVLEDFSALGVTVLSLTTTTTDHVLRIQSDAADLPDMARIEELSWIEPTPGQAGLDNAVASATVQSGSLGNWPLHDRGIDGSTQIVTLCDTGVNSEPDPPSGLSLARPILSMTHRAHDDDGGLGLIEYNAIRSPAPLPLPDHRKVVAYYSPQEDGNHGDWDDDHGHGTQMAATMVGDAPPYGIRNGNDGIAPAARLVVCDAAEPLFFHILDDYANYWGPAYELGARVSSNSWGTDPTDAYTIPARQQDAFIRDHRDLVLVRSMGNFGPDGLPRPEALSKSVVAVGATFNDGVADSMSPTSSSGPAADGRIKPDVVAPGKCLMTAHLPDATSETCSSGTSAATALVAGAATLVRDYFAKGFHPSGAASPSDAFEPSSALVRALLIASGQEIADDRDEAGFPNRVQGWGRVQLNDTLPFAGDDQHLLVWDEDVSLETGDAATFAVQLPPVEDLRVVLAWTDAPAAPGASSALVNDLDLLVKGPHGVHVTGNDFRESPGRRPGTPDRANVIEAVILDSMPPGEFVIEVRAHNVPDGPQPFALAAVGRLSS